MRSLSAWLLVPFLVCLGFADVASSGAFVDEPFESSTCGGLDIAGDYMDDPNGAFSESGSGQSCRRLCARAAKQCQAYAKDTARCQQRYAKDLWGWIDENCEVVHEADPELRRACKQSAKTDFLAEKTLLRSNRDDALGDCAFWGVTCQEDCVPL